MVIHERTRESTWYDTLRARDAIDAKASEGMRVARCLHTHAFLYGNQVRVPTVGTEGPPPFPHHPAHTCNLYRFREELIFALLAHRLRCISCTKVRCSDVEEARSFDSSNSNLPDPFEKGLEAVNAFGLAKMRDSSKEGLSRSTCQNYWRSMLGLGHGVSRTRTRMPDPLSDTTGTQVSS